MGLRYRSCMSNVQGFKLILWWLCGCSNMRGQWGKSCNLSSLGQADKVVQSAEAKTNLDSDKIASHFASPTYFRISYRIYIQVHLCKYTYTCIFRYIQINGWVVNFAATMLRSIAWDEAESPCFFHGESHVKTAALGPWGQLSRSNSGGIQK